MTTTIETAGSGRRFQWHLGATIAAISLAFLPGASFADEVTLDFSTFLGGAGSDGSRGVATDEDGFVYVGGATTSSSFPGSPGIVGNAVYVVKLDVDASPPTIEWSSIFDGSGVDQAWAIGVGVNGVYVAGWTNSTDLAIQTFRHEECVAEDPGTSRDPFVLKLDKATGSIEAGARLLASGTIDMADSLAIDAVTGRVYISGRTLTRPSAECPFPTTDGSSVNCSANGHCDVDLFLSVFSPDLDLEHSTVIGGTDIDAHVPAAASLAIGAGGTAYIAGYTESKDFPVTDGSTRSGREDGVLVVIALLPGGATQVTWAGYIGGSGKDRASAVEVDGGTVWLGGRTESDDFPGVSIANAGQADALVAKLDATQDFAVLHTTLLGGSSGDGLGDLALDADGNVFACGASSSTDFPVTPDAEDATHNGQSDVFVARVDSGGNLIYATVLGGQFDESPAGIALSSLATDPPGTVRVRVAGQTRSNSFPTTPDALDASYGGDPDDAFVASYRFVSGPPAENCTNGVDDDGDGLVDCADDDCDSDPACEAPSCGEKNDPCSTNDDCCSGNCRPNGRCAGGQGGGGGLGGVLFVRGDANDDSLVDIADGVFTLEYLFAGGRQPACLDAADADDDGVIAILDPVVTLAYLFSGGATIAEPHPGSGQDTTPDALGCEE